MLLSDIVMTCREHPRTCTDCPLYDGYLTKQGPCYKAMLNYHILIPGDISDYYAENDEEEY